MDSDFIKASTDYFDRAANWFNAVKLLIPTEQDNSLLWLFVVPDVKKGIDSHSRSSSTMPISAVHLLNKDRSGRIVLLGDSGSGKTALLNYLALALVSEQPFIKSRRLPILIDVCDLLRFPNINFFGYARHFAEQCMQVKQLPDNFFSDWLTEGNAVILLDGLDAIDEIVDPSKRLEVLIKIESFLAHYPQSLAIITSRPAGYRRDFLNSSEFTFYSLEPFDYLKIDRYIDRCDNLRVQDKESIKQQLINNDRLRLLASNPLLLTIMTSIYGCHPALPDTRHRLYEKFVSLLLNCPRNGITVQSVFLHLDADDVQRLVEIVAYWVHTHGHSQIDNPWIAKIDLLSKLTQEIQLKKIIDFASSRDEAERFINFIQHIELVREQEQNWFSFQVKILQEYLCAREVCYQADNEDDFSIVSGFFYKNLHDPRLHNPHWREVLLLLVSQLPPKKVARVLRIVLNNNSVNEKHTHGDLLFAGSCFAENIKGLSEIDPNLVAEILERLVELEAQDVGSVGARVLSQVFQILGKMKGTEFQLKTAQLLKKRCVDEEQLSRYELAVI